MNLYISMYMKYIRLLYFYHKRCIFFRSRNQAADCLAKRALDVELGYHFVDQPPNVLWIVLEKDCPRHPSVF